MFYADTGKRHKEEETREWSLSHGVLLLHGISLGLTFACIHALKPRVIYVFVCSTSAVLVPSAARSATTDSARFRKRAALWTYLLTKDR